MGYIAHTVAVWKTIWSEGFPFEEKQAQRYTVQSFDRYYYPLGAAHHNIAVSLAGDRRPALSQLHIPTVVK